MRIDINLKGLEKFEKTVNRKIINKAANRTIRRMGTRFRTTAVKEVRKTYNIKAKTLKQKIRARTHYDKEGNQSWRFYVSGKPMSLIHFAPRQTKKGVSVKIKKQSGRKIIKGAFIAKGKNGNLRVFKRVGKERLPLDTKYTISIPQMFNEEILDKAKKEVEDNYQQEFERNINYYLRSIK